MDTTPHIDRSSTNGHASIGHLVSRLTQGFSRLARQEVELAKAEMREKLTELAREFAVLGVGAIVAMIAVLALLSAAGLGLAQAIPGWAAALILGVTLAVIAAATVLIGIQQLQRTDLTPHRTVETMRENKRWMEEQIS